MEQRNTWTASSKSFEKCDEDNLSALVGRWNENLHVVVSLPTTVTQGPLARHVTPKEKHYIQPSIQSGAWSVHAVEL